MPPKPIEPEQSAGTRWFPEDFENEPDKSSWSKNKKRSYAKAKKDYFDKKAAAQKDPLLTMGRANNSTIISIPFRPVAGNVTSLQKDPQSSSEHRTSDSINELGKSGKAKDPDDTPKDSSPEFQATWLAEHDLNADEPKAVSFRNALETNHFDIQINSVKLYRYSCSEKIERRDRKDPAGKVNCDEQPERKLPARVRRRIFVLLVKKLSKEHNVEVATNFKNQLVTSSKLPGFDQGRVVEVTYYDEDEFVDDPKRNVFLIETKPCLTIDIDTVEQHLRCGKSAPNAFFSDKASATAAIDSALDALNVVLSDVANKNTVRYAYRPLGKVAEGQEPDTAFIGASKFYSFKPLEMPSAPQDSMALNEVDRTTTSPSPWKLNHRSDSNFPGLAAMIGCSRSVRPVMCRGFVLNLNAVTGCFYQNIRLLNLLDAFYNKTGNLNMLDKFISGLRVRTTYMRQNPALRAKAKSENRFLRERIYTLSGFAYVLDEKTKKREFLTYPREVTFLPQSAEAVEQKPRVISVLDYWKISLGIRLDEQNDWIVRVGDKNRALYFPARFLEILPGQNYKGKVDMVREACRDPEANFRYIKAGARNLLGLSTSASSTTRFGPCVSADPVKPIVHLFEKPYAVYNGERKLFQRQKKGTPPPKEAKWNLEEMKLSHTPQDTVKYAAIQIRGDKPFNSDNYQRLDKELRACIPKYGFNGIECVNPKNARFDRDLCIDVEIRKKDDFRDPIDVIQERIRKKLDEIKTQWRADIIFVYLADNSDKVYALLKRAAELVVGIPTLCIAWNNGGFKGNLSDLVANLALKVNLRLGPFNYNHITTTLQRSVRERTVKILNSETMFVGIDVTHPGGGAMKEAPSVAAMVSSHSLDFVMYSASYRLNPLEEIWDSEGKSKKRSNEQVMQVGSMLAEHLNGWREKNKAWPKQIVVYRDGLSESQFDMCKTQEIRNMKGALAKVFASEPQNCPKILVVCTVKRNHCRFNGLSKGSKVVDRNGNAVSGTVVYDGVTRGDDFFLISHTAIQGTARPMHYVVLHNELSNTNMEDIARTTFELCFTWARSTTASGLVPPSRYADKACDRARCYLYKLYNGHEGSEEVYKGFDPSVSDTHEHKVWSRLDVHGDLTDRMIYV